MSKIAKALLPYLLVLLGLFFLVIMNIPIVAGACVLIGLVMICERIWPEKWDDKDIIKQQ